MAERVDVMGALHLRSVYGYVIIIKILRGTIATIYPSTHPRYVYSVGL